MILRAAAAVALLAGSAILLGYLHWVGKAPFSSPEARHLRAMKDRKHAPDSIAPMTFADFVALPSGRPLAEYAPLERRGVSLEGYVHTLRRSSDGDYYLYVTPSTHPLPVDLAGITTELTPEWWRGSRRWRFEPLAAILRSHTGGGPEKWPALPRRARISGWLLYDFQYDKKHAPKRFRLPGSGWPSLTAWEIHPVTRIEVWDDSLGRYVEVPR